MAGWLLLLFLAALVSVHFAMMLAKSGSLFLTTDAYVQFGERRPYQYRLLMAPVLGALMDWLRHPALAHLFARLPRYLAGPEPLAYFMVNSVACMAALLALWPLAARVHAHGQEDGGALRTISVGLFIGLLYAFFCLNPNLSFVLPYDIAAIAFTVWALLLWRLGWWAALFVLMVPATLNRETILFVPVCIAVHALLGWRLMGRGAGLTGRCAGLAGRGRADLVRAGGLVAVWAAIKIALAIKLAHLPSEQGLRLVYNAEELAKPWQWPAIFILPLLLVLTAQAAMMWSGARAFAVTALLGGAILFTAGQITETRAFGELIPYLALGLAPLIWHHLSPSSA